MKIHHEDPAMNMIDPANPLIAHLGTTTSARPPVQTEFSWPDGQVVVVGLKLHETSHPYAIPAESMKR